jgi:FkbM family methyltransferase
MGGIYPALSYIVTTRSNSFADTTAHYGEINFRFRRCDISAIREVLMEHEYGFLREALETVSNPLIYDIGAHIGLFAIWTLSINSKADVRSIEASPNTFKILSSNVAQARTAHLSWQAENKAAWESNEAIAFSDSSESSMSHRIDQQGKVKVAGMTLADVTAQVKDRDAIDLLKIDIEGAEEAFLCTEDGKGLEVVRRLVIELHPALCDTKKVMTVLEKHFSKIKVIEDRKSSKPILYCQK